LLVYLRGLLPAALPFTFTRFGFRAVYLRTFYGLPAVPFCAPLRTARFAFCHTFTYAHTSHAFRLLVYAVPFYARVHTVFYARAFTVCGFWRFTAGYPAFPLPALPTFYRIPRFAAAATICLRAALRTFTVHCLLLVLVAFFVLCGLLPVYVAHVALYHVYAVAVTLRITLHCGYALPTGSRFRFCFIPGSTLPHTLRFGLPLVYLPTTLFAHVLRLPAGSGSRTPVGSTHFARLHTLHLRFTPHLRFTVLHGSHTAHVHCLYAHTFAFGSAAHTLRFGYSFTRLVLVTAPGGSVTHCRFPVLPFGFLLRTYTVTHVRYAHYPAHGSHRTPAVGCLPRCRTTVAAWVCLRLPLPHTHAFGTRWVLRLGWLVGWFCGSFTHAPRLTHRTLLHCGWLLYWLYTDCVHGCTVVLPAHPAWFWFMGCTRVRRFCPRTHCTCVWLVCPVCSHCTFYTRFGLHTWFPVYARYRSSRLHALPVAYGYTTFALLVYVYALRTFTVYARTTPRIHLYHTRGYVRFCTRTGLVGSRFTRILPRCYAARFGLHHYTGWLCGYVHVYGLVPVLGCFTLHGSRTRTLGWWAAGVRAASTRRHARFTLYERLAIAPAPLL